MNFRRRRLLLTVAVAALVSAVVVADFGARQLLEPVRTPLDPAFIDLRDHPGRHGLRLTPFEVATADGLILKALLTEPTGTWPRDSRTLAMRPLLAERGISFRKDRGTILLLHGLSGRKEHLLAMASRFAAAGFRSVVFDARAHGESDGRYCTFGWREADDARRILAETIRRFGPPGPVHVLGYSMGGVTALRLAPDEPLVRSAVAVAPFADLSDVVTRQTARRWHGLLHPLIPLVRLCVWARAGFDPWSIEAVSACRKGACPVLLVHGAQDQVIPAAQTERLATERLATEPRVGPVRRHVVPDAGHANVFVKGGNGLYAEVVAFFVGAPGARPITNLTSR